MVIVKLLGLMDVLAGIGFILAKIGIAKTFIWVLIIYLALKFIVFRSFVGFIDVIAAIFLIAAIYGYMSIVSWLFMIWLLQKGFFSLIS